MAKRTIRLLISVLAVTLSTLVYATPEDTLKKQFLTLQKNYFLKLDLRAPAQELHTIPKFAATLSKLADAQRTLLTTDKTLTTADKELAGLILIYDAMLNVNIINGVLTDKLVLADFTKEKHFAKRHATQHAELIARAKYSLAALKLAATLRPNDHRIDSWIVGTNGTLENVQFGHLSKQTQAAIIQAISARPSFNLWTAILVLHNEPQALKQQLVTAAKSFVDATQQGKDPCTLHPDDCVSTWKAPYNFEAAVTELGDVFLEQAEYALQQKNIENAMTMAGYAKGTYEQLANPKYSTAMKQWPDHDVLAMREHLLADINQQKVPTIPLRQMSDYQRPYECASCHGRVK